MPDPFDEIRKNRQRKLDELAKQKQAEEKLEQQRKEQRDKACLRFSNELSKRSTTMIEILEILEEFRLVCSASPNARFEEISFDNWGLEAVADFSVQIPIDIGRSESKEISFRIVGNEHGNIAGYELGTYSNERTSSSDYAPFERVYTSKMQLSPNASPKTIKDALLKLYKTFKPWDFV